MRALIVESSVELATLWRRHLERQGMEVSIAASSDDAVTLISDLDFDVIVIDLVLDDGSAIAVSDYAQMRQPSTNLIFVTNTSFFSDGSIFSLGPTARALLQSSAPPEDIAATAAHYAQASRRIPAAPVADVFVR